MVKGIMGVMGSIGGVLGTWLFLYQMGIVVFWITDLYAFPEPIETILNLPFILPWWAW